MSHRPPPLTRNMLLAKLSPRDLSRIKQAASYVDLAAGEIVCEEGAPLKYAYFPLSNVFSSLLTCQHNRKIETSIIGPEGLVGASLADGLDLPASHQVVQQVVGHCVAIPARYCARLLAELPALRKLVRRFVHTLLYANSLAGFCLRFHATENRLARWLLETVDRCQSNRFQLKQDYLVYMLGVHRQAVSRHITALKERGILYYARGIVEVLDPAAMESTACECYARGRRMYRTMMQAGLSGGGGVTG